MTSHFRIVFDAYKERFFIEKKHLGFLWLRDHTRVVMDRIHNFYPNRYGFALEEGALIYLNTVRRENEIFKKDQVQEKAKDRFRVVQSLDFKD
jgi:hypothetical protein